MKREVRRRVDSIDERGGLRELQRVSFIMSRMIRRSVAMKRAGVDGREACVGVTMSLCPMAAK